MTKRQCCTLKPRRKPVFCLKKYFQSAQRSADSRYFQKLLTCLIVNQLVDSSFYYFLNFSEYDLHLQISSSFGNSKNLYCVIEMIKKKGKKFPFQYFSRYVSFMHGLGCRWLWVVAYFFYNPKTYSGKSKIQVFILFFDCKYTRVALIFMHRSKNRVLNTICSKYDILWYCQAYFWHQRI